MYSSFQGQNRPGGMVQFSSTVAYNRLRPLSRTRARTQSQGDFAGSVIPYASAKSVEEKANRKVQKHSDCYVCVPYIYIGLRYFSRNLSGKCCNIFIFCKTSFGPRTFYSGAPLGPRGPRPPARIGSKASWQIALRPHRCEYTRMMVS
jgi:hypothetical protein